MNDTRAPDWVLQRRTDTGVTFLSTHDRVWLGSVASARGMTREAARWGVIDRREFDGDTRFAVRERRWNADGTAYLVEETPPRERALRALDSLDRDGREALLEIIASGAKLA